jgi:biotin carboxyl carrier protein
VAPGVVEAILVEPGKVVEKGQVLVVLGASPST